VEPVVFGVRTGVSSFALLISALFWIWVWGPIGLLLATPLTVCFAVLGRHVRSLRFLAVIFADEPALAPHVRFYQRLLAHDEDEANALVDQQLAELGPIGLIDHVLTPALALVVQHRSQGEISEEDEQFVLDVAAETVHQIAPAETAPATDAPLLMGVAARTAVDQVLLEMLCVGLAEIRMEPAPADLSSEQAMQRVLDRKPALLCVAAISPTRGAELRNYCRIVRSALPETTILVLRPALAGADVSKSAARMKDAGADYVATSVADAVETIENLLAGASKRRVGEARAVGRESGIGNGESQEVA
jgi:hypothetical protein